MKLKEELLTLSKLSRYLYLYLNHVVSVNMLGYTKISMQTMAAETLLNESEVYDILYDLQEKKLATYDLEYEELLLLTHSRRANLNQMQLLRLPGLVDTIASKKLKKVANNLVKGMASEATILKKKRIRKSNRALESNIKVILEGQLFEDVVDRWNNFALYNRLEFATALLTGDTIVKISNTLIGMLKSEVGLEDLFNALRLVLANDSKYSITFDRLIDGGWVEILKLYEELIDKDKIKLTGTTNDWSILAKEYGFEANNYEEFIVKLINRDNDKLLQTINKKVGLV